MSNVFVIVINVENHQNSYYEFLDLFIGCLKENPEEIFNNNKCDETYGYYKENIKLFSKEEFRELAKSIEDLYQTESLENHTFFNNKWMKANKIVLHFRLQMEENSDVVNLQYYFLIKQYLESQNEGKKVPICCELVIDYNRNFEMIFKISQFLILESKDNSPVFLKNDDVMYPSVVNLPGNAGESTYGVKSLEKFYPLLKINNETYKMLSERICDAFSLEDTKVYRFPERKCYNYMSSRMTKKDILVDMCINFFTKGKYKKETEQRTQFFYSEEFFDIVKNMNLLSFLILCSFTFYIFQLAEENQEEGVELSIYNLQQQVSMVNNLASGLLQIIENVVAHSERQQGYFVFRIHNADAAYLKTTYNNYIKKIENQFVCNMFLEIKILDLGLVEMQGGYSSTLAGCFIENLKKRAKNNEPSMSAFVNKFKHLTVRNFFLLDTQDKEYNDVWKEYYSIQKNWLHHYGLKLYERIINMLNGFFEVNSQNGLNRVDKEQYYASIDGGKRDTNFLPGTQYNILIPYLTDEYIQSHIGVDCDVKYDFMMQKMLDFKIKSHKESLKQLFIEFAKIDTERNKKISTSYKSLQNLKEKYIEIAQSKIEDVYNRYNKNMKENDIIPVLIFDLDGIRSSFWLEIVAKAMWGYICNDNNETFYCALINSPFEVIQYLTHIIAVCFGLNPHMTISKEIQLYVCNKNGAEDFLISGKNLVEIRSRAYKYAASRGVFPYSLTNLFLNLGTDPDDIEIINEQFDIIPFDTFVEDKNGKLFFQLVTKVMEREIYYSDYGCKLPLTHIRLGSKIHIHNFYEAEILFQDSYFSKRMAYFVANDIVCKKNTVKSHKKIVLVGYEKYSEMFIFDIHKCLNEYTRKHNVPFSIGDYTICMDINGELIFTGLKTWNSIDEVEFVIIVSINSTLTTHSKIKSALERKLDVQDLPIFANYAVILLRDNNILIKNNTLSKKEKDFWEYIDVNTKVIKSRYIDKEIKYFISSSAQWEDPLCCSLCFPSDVLDEKALINTNKTSTIPSLQYGLIQKSAGAIWVEISETKENKKARLDKWEIEDVENERKLKMLASAVNYGHIKRNDNHFLYYFDTRKLLEENRDEVQKWLKEIVRKQVQETNKADKYFFGVYNIIVTPLHESNTGFIELLNDMVFDNTAYIMRFEVNRIYRSNMLARYSNLTVLYERLIETAKKIGGKARINLFYADDTIVSGRSYERAYTLVQSLYRSTKPEMEKWRDKVEVNIFKGCFFLLNRLSLSSREGMFGKDCTSYFYFNVPISSIRNHQNFCFMCNLIKDAYQLRIKSSTNEIAQRWKKVETRFKLNDYYDYKYDENKKIRYQNRFYSTYWSNLELGRLGEDAQDTEKVCKMIVERLFVKQMGINPLNKKMSNNDKLEVLFSYVKVLSRPFLNYQWRTREAIFYLILLFLEVLLDENIKNRNDIEELIKKSKFKYSGDIKKLRDICGVIKDCKTIRKNGKFEDLLITYSMLIIFIKQAMELNSNYIIRKRNVIKINQKYQEIKEGLEKFFDLENKKDEINSIQDFENLYIRYVKQLTSLSGDEKKCVWLEELLLTGNEPSGEIRKIDEDFIKRYGIESDLGKKLYIENTGVIQEALESLTTELHKKKGSDETKKTVEEWLGEIITDKGRYYLKSFFDILRLNNFVNITNKDNSISTDCLTMLKNVLKLNNLLISDKEDKELEEFYQKMMIYFATILDSPMAQCIIVVEKENVYCLLEINKEKESYIKKGGSIVAIKKENLATDDMLLKTFKFINADSKQYLLIRFESDTDSNNSEKENKDISEIQLVIKPIYFVFDVSGKNPIDIIKRLRFILSMRANIVEKIEQDFKNNSFQEMLEEKNQKMLLSVWKNATHSDGWIYSNVIDSMRQNRESKEGNKDEYIKKLEGMVLRLLSDSNVSSKYHASLTGNMNERYALDKKSIYAVAMPFNESIIADYVSSLVEMPQREQDNVVCTGIEIKNMNGWEMLYFNGEQNQAMLMIVPIIQNAIKYCMEGEKVKIYAKGNAKFSTVNGEKKNSLTYLCIENILANPRDNLKSQMENYIKYPVGMREKSQLDSQNGISLYAVNQYLKKLVETIYKKSINFKEEPLLIEMNKRKMIIKLPILMKKEKIRTKVTNDEIYYS